jgi:hypothetical protein
MILADLNDLVREYLFTSSLGIYDNCLNGKTSLFQVLPGLLVYRLVFGRYFFPEKVFL